MSFKERLKQFDLPGTFVFLPAVICLLIGLQWGGTRYAWSNGRIIALLIMAGLLTIAFLGIQYWKQDTATVPPRILMQRSMAFGVFFSFCLGGAYFVFVYYLPIWFQAIKGVSATQSGVMNLPLIMTHVIAALLAGVIISIAGYYTPFMIASSVLMSVGAGLISTWKVDTHHPKWIGYQALFGLGCGLGMNQPLIAAQTVLHIDHVSVGTALVIFGQTLGGAIFISAGENIFTNKLLQGLRSAAPELDPAVVLTTGATQLRQAVESQFLPGVIFAYNGALIKAFYAAVALSSLTIIGSLGMEWRSVKEVKGEKINR